MKFTAGEANPCIKFPDTGFEFLNPALLGAQIVDDLQAFLFSLKVLLFRQ